MTDDVRVEVRRSGRRFEAEALLDLAADAQTVWDTITDYGALAQFMPGIRANGHATVIGGHATVGRLSNNVFWTVLAIRKCFEKSR